METKNIFYDDSFDYHSLSIKDLIEARDMFHVHLLKKRNVIATAIGRYLIRKSDIDEYGRYCPKPEKPNRTLENSVVLDISWPCILVFVEKWEQKEELIRNNANDVISKAIYMPDGRVIPVCVVEVNKNKVVDSIINTEKLVFPNNLIGGGFPIIIYTQGVEKIASVGCLVSDGHKYYAITNKHVTGDAGDEIYSKFGNTKSKIGVSSGICIGKIKFTELYPGWESKNLLVNCDIGLIDIDDIKRWKTDVFKIGEINEIYDLNIHNLSLGLIAQHSKRKGKFNAENGKVFAFGAVSGNMEGEILALFYRYKSVGGSEYISDFLIGGKDGMSLNVHHGDSGTLWLIEKRDESGQPKLYPLALHWGQHEYFSGDKKNQYGYSMATCLSNICRILDVDLVRGWNTDTDFSWGKVGHYTISYAVIDAIKDGKLKKFMSNNLLNISLERDYINEKLNKKKNNIPNMSNNPDDGFCALADVPDIIWKQTNSRTTPWGRKGYENPNHYSDVDAPTTEGKKLFEICNSKDKLTTEVLKNYYENIDKEITGIKSEDPRKFGVLPLRVIQTYNYMVKALREKRADKFLFASGVLAHYIGDSCMPLHSSYMSNGDPLDDKMVDYTAKKTSYHKNGSVSHYAGDVYQKKINPGNGVHLAYEDHLIDDNIEEIFNGIIDILNDKNSDINNESIDVIDSGQAAGYASLQLMEKTQKDVNPKDIVELYKQIKGQDDVSTQLYNAFGTNTINCIARGCRYLAAIWEAAWKAGNGEKNISDIGAIKQDDLIKLYRDTNELPSKTINEIDEVLEV